MGSASNWPVEAVMHPEPCMPNVSRKTQKEQLSDVRNTRRAIDFHEGEKIDENPADRAEGSF